LGIQYGTAPGQVKVEIKVEVEDTKKPARAGFFLIARLYILSAARMPKLRQKSDFGKKSYLS
jgi:hypothetical protein